MWDARTPFLAGEVAICGQAPLSMFASVLLPLAVAAEGSAGAGATCRRPETEAACAGAPGGAVKACKHHMPVRLRRLMRRKPWHKRAFLDLAELLQRRLRQHRSDNKSNKWRREAAAACKRHLEIAEARKRKMPHLTERTLRVDLAKHLLCVIEQQTPAEIAATYVTSLFDHYADCFDASLESLSYQVPQLLVQAIRWSQEEPCHLRRILDLGAGTGNMGEQLRDLSPRAHLQAVDLSAQMLQKAEAKSCYDELHCSDLAEHLMASERSGLLFDLITAADVFGYVTDLSAIFRLVFQNLESGGLFVFSTEEPTQPEEPEDPEEPEPDVSLGYKLQASGRVAHSHSYILSLVHDCKFQVLRDTRCELRFEDGHPVLGRVFSLTKSPSAQRQCPSQHEGRAG
ncbi:bioC [Symbiodinium natans]|uniref:BioC protein n=1 Tax=Symbiodinium natans TaxID=878477 RepID=A0A812QBG6_9DINO|nr:bioC [Symbiodinium natans]